MGARKRIRKPPAPARRMHHGDVQEALRRAAAGWTAEDIARSLAIDLDDVRVWMLTLQATQRAEQTNATVADLSARAQGLEDEIGRFRL